tara:strand:+ start:287 stop:538 length:252 start_codon:yes stop_codon:yes gene_type:complete
MIVVRCKNCNRELSSQSGKTQCCGCSNMTTLVDDVITAKDLGKVIIVKNSSKTNEKFSLTSEDLIWQEARKQRKIRKLDFEIR